MSPPGALPSVLTETRPVDGFRLKHWVARPLEAGEGIELQRALIELDLRLSPAPEGKTLELVSRLLNNWKDDRSDQEKDWQFDDWAEDLEEFSEAHLKAACRQWRRNNTYRPKIAEIRSMCIAEQDRDKEMHRRCRVLLGIEPPSKWEVVPAPHRPITLDAGQRAKIESIVGKLES